MIDYHTHTSFSDDCKFSMNEMIKSAIEKGVKEYAITDHHDPDYPIDQYNYTFELDFENYHKALDEHAEKYKRNIRIVKGVELGLQLGSAMTKCRECVKYPYDFVIGSFHLIDYMDICKPFHDGRTPEEANRFYYEYMLDTITEFRDFNVLGHINAIDRYTAYVPDFKPYEEVVGEILKLLISNGTGIELNTSSFRYKMNDSMPSSRILDMYKDLGGSIITIGSDSHNPAHIAFNYNWAVSYLKSKGFDKIATFKNREPQFLSI